MEERRRAHPDAGALPNGPGAAAVLASGFGCFALGVLSVAADKSHTLKTMLNFYPPSGPLSGVTTCAVAIWLVAWALLEWRWRKRDVAMARMNTAAFVLLGLGLLLTIPAVGDLF